jgi:hypothetical protein
LKEDYPVFTKWYKVLDWIMDTTEKYPKSARFTIATSTVNTSTALLEGIIEAIYTKDRTHILEKLNLYIEKLRVYMRIAHDRRYISVRQYEYISEELNETGKMIGGWLKREKTKLPV